MSHPCTSRTTRLAATLAILALMGVAPAARAGDASTTPMRPLLGPGTTPEGSPIGDVAFSPLRLVYGQAGWIMDVTLEGHVEMIVAENGLGVYEGQVLPGGDTVDEIWLGLDGDESGRLAAIVFMDDGVGPTESALVFDDTVVLREGDPLAADGAEAGSTWHQIIAVDLDRHGHAYVYGEFIEPFGAPGHDVLAIVRFDIDAGGALTAPTVMLREGDLFEGRPIDWVGGAIDVNWDTNDAGQVLSTVRFVEEGEVFGPAAIVLDGVVLAEDGQPSVITGRDWVMNYGDPLALSEQGDVAFRSRIVAGADDSREILVHNNQVVAMADVPAPGVPDSILTRIHGPHFSDDGTLLWLAEWDGNPGFGGMGFYRGDELVVRTGVTPIDGLLLSYVHNDVLKYDISADGTRCAFIGGNNVVPGWSVWEASIGPWEDLGGALAGTDGVEPALFPLGSLEGDTTVSLSLSKALPGATTNLVVGASELGLPFYGGVLCPSPDLLLLGLPVGDDGTFEAAGNFPSGAPAGIPLYLQFWTDDPGGPFGYSASNCVRGETP